MINRIQMTSNDVNAKIELSLRERVRNLLQQADIWLREKAAPVIPTAIVLHRLGSLVKSTLLESISVAGAILLAAAIFPSVHEFIEDNPIKVILMIGAGVFVEFTVGWLLHGEKRSTLDNIESVLKVVSSFIIVVAVFVPLLGNMLDKSVIQKNETVNEQQQSAIDSAGDKYNELKQQLHDSKEKIVALEESLNILAVKHKDTKVALEEVQRRVVQQNNE